MRRLGPLSLGLALGATLAGCGQAEPVEVLDDRPALVSTQRLGGAATLPSRMAFGEPPAGLRLKLAVKGGQEVFESGASIPIEAKLVNTSNADITVALPGDGSYKGWREPAVRFSADRKDPNGYAPMKTEVGIGCGNYDSEWQDDLGTVPARGELAIDFWATPGMYLDFYEPGDVRLFAHYEYARGHWRRSGGPVPAKLKDVPAFKLVSNAVPLRIERPLEISIEVLKPLDSGEGNPLSEVVAVRIHNRSHRPRIIVSPYTGSNRSSLWLRSDDDDVDSADVRYDFEAPTAEKTLGPGDTLTLVGPDEAFSSKGSHWTVDKPGTFRVRAFFRGKENYSLMSDWVTIEAR